MKNLLFIFGLILSSPAYTQTKIDSLKKENNRLTAETSDLKNPAKQAIQSTTYTMNLPEITLNDINFKIVKVSGDKKTGNVEVLMFVVAQKRNEKLTLKDILGSNLSADSPTEKASIKGNTETEKLDLRNGNTSQVLIHFSNFPTDADWLRILKFTGEIVNVNTTKNLGLEFKDIKIRWE